MSERERVKRRKKNLYTHNLQTTTMTMEQRREHTADRVACFARRRRNNILIHKNFFFAFIKVSEREREGKWRNERYQGIFLCVLESYTNQLAKQHRGWIGERILLFKILSWWSQHRRIEFREFFCVWPYKVHDMWLQTGFIPFHKSLKIMWKNSNHILRIIQPITAINWKDDDDDIETK